MIGAQHPRKFAGRQRNVHIRIAAGVVEIRDRDLVLLCCAGHDRHTEDVVRVGTDLFGKIALNDRAEHSLRRFCRGKVVGKFRILPLEEPDPTRAAGGHQRKRAAVLQAVQKLAAFFHDRQIGREIGVEHIVKTERLRCGSHALFGRFLFGKAEALRPCSTHGGRDLQHSELAFVRKRGIDFIGVVTHTQRADRAVGDALSAQRAIGVGKLFAALDADRGTAAGALDFPDVKGLHLVAHLHAAHAFDALARLTHQREIAGADVLFRRVLIGEADDIQIVRNGLQLAVAGAHAGRAMAVVLAEDQLHIHLARLAHTRAVGENLHPLFGGGVARGGKAVYAFDLHNADAARADLVEFFEIAQGRDRDARLFCGVKDRGSFGDLQGDIINFDVYHEISLPPLKAPKPKWSQRRQRADSCAACCSVIGYSISLKSNLRSAAGRSGRLIRPQGGWGSTGGFGISTSTAIS